METLFALSIFLAASAFVAFFIAAVHHRTPNIFKFKVIKINDNVRIDIIDWYRYVHNFKEFNVGDIVCEKRTEYEIICGANPIKRVIVEKSNNYYKLDTIEVDPQPAGAGQSFYIGNPLGTITWKFADSHGRSPVVLKATLHRTYELCKETLVKNDTAELLK